MNLANFMFFCYLMLEKYNLREQHRMAMLKDICFLTVFYYLKDSEIVYCLIPCLLITTVIFAICNL